MPGSTSYAVGRIAEISCRAIPRRKILEVHARPPTALKEEALKQLVRENKMFNIRS